MSRHLTIVVSLIVFSLLGRVVVAEPIRWDGNGHYYALVLSDDIAWDAAKTGAEASTWLGVNGHLASVASAGENDFIHDLLPAEPQTRSWLAGAQDSDGTEPGGGWRWITGEPWEYTNWNPLEPNNFEGNEECLEINGQQGTWNDQDCVTDTDQTIGYIVEYEIPIGIPAVSEWGVIALALLFLTAGSIVFAKRQREIAA